MVSVGIRELKNNLSRFIRRVEAGARIVVTDRGRVVAELRPPEQDSIARDRYVELVAAGTIRPASESGDPLADWPEARALRLPAGTAAALIDEDRGP